MTWKLINTETNKEINKGDIVDGFRGQYEIVNFYPPHKPESSGKVGVIDITFLSSTGWDMDLLPCEGESLVYASIVNGKYIMEN